MTRGLSGPLSDGVELAAVKRMEESWPTPTKSLSQRLRSLRQRRHGHLRQLMVKTPSGIRRAAISSRVTTAASALVAGDGQQYLQVLGRYSQRPGLARRLPANPG